MTTDVEHAVPLSSSSSPLSDDDISHCADSLRAMEEEEEEEQDSPLFISLTLNSNEAIHDPQQHPNNNNNNNNTRLSLWIGPLLLLLVAFLYATLNVCLRWLYLMPDPLSPATLSMTRGWLIMGFFVPIVAGHSRLVERRQRRRRRGRQLSSSTRTEPRQQQQQQQQQQQPESPYPSLWKAAAELAIFNFFGQALYNWGIASVSSARAAFLGQTTVVFVPLLLSFSGEALQMWDGMGCLSSLVGLILFSVENGVAAGSGGGGVGDSGSRVDASSIYYQNHTNDHDHQQKQHSVKLHLGLGEVMILCSAVCWSFCLIGTSKYAHAYDTIYLQGAKNALLAVLCTLWWLITIVPMGTAHEQEETVDSRQTDAGHATTIGSTSSTTMTAWLILIYSALGPGILADLIQQQGQAMATGATGSNLILCMESLFTAVLGRLLLGEETSWIEKLGGACLVLGALISSAATSWNASSPTTKTTGKKEI